MDFFKELEGLFKMQGKEICHTTLGNALEALKEH
jgi:hypothetical protein